MNFEVREMETEELSDLFRYRKNIGPLKNPNIGILTACGQHEVYQNTPLDAQLRLEPYIDNDSGQIYALLMYPNDDVYAGFEVTQS